MQSKSDRYGTILDIGAGAKEGIEIYKISWKGVAVSFQTFDKKCFLKKTPSTEQGWVYIVVSWCPSFVKMYFDGGLVAKRDFSSITTVLVTRTPGFVIGVSDDYRVFFNGTLDELHVWDAVMSDEGVMAIYTVDAGLN